MEKSKTEIKIEELDQLIRDKVHEGLESGELIGRPVRMATGFTRDFRKFATKGSITDMAAGFVVGSSFGKIVSSFVGDLIMPIVGVMTGGVDFKEMTWTIGDGVKVRYGLFLENLMDFIIIALCVFIAVRLIQKLRDKEDEIIDRLEEKEDEIVKKIQEDLAKKLKDTK